jgi:hypothetical protein
MVVEICVDGYVRDSSALCSIAVLLPSFKIQFAHANTTAPNFPPLKTTARKSARLEHFTRQTGDNIYYGSNF